MGILDLLESEKVHLTEEACLNYLNRNEVCHICISSCPKEALSLSHSAKNPISYHSLSCNECGACVGACPTLAFDFPHKPYLSILEQIKEHPECSITCEQDITHPNGIKVPCYLYLDLTLLGSFAEKKERITFSLYPCLSCNKGEKELIKRHFEKLQGELDRLSCNMRILLTDEALPKEKEKPVEGISRRELLKMLSPSNLWEQWNKRWKGGEKKEDLLPLRERMILKRKRVLTLISSMSREDRPNALSDLHEEGLIRERGIPVKSQRKQNGHKNDPNWESMEMNRVGAQISIRIDEECDGCAVCEKICPTGALYWEEKDGECHLQFQSERCVYCRKCTQCPKGALRLIISTHEHTGKQHLNRERLPSFLRKICPNCGQEFRTRGIEEECEVCRKRKMDPRFFAL
ncbi:MAG: 4Fe-4S dicluster domain-containing protein [Thermicanus sp.]|nr:4Fe-4S dicluster domain-containing protein [Thermicanus sp.]